MQFNAVAATNVHAIKLYDELGFTDRGRRAARLPPPERPVSSTCWSCTGTCDRVTAAAGSPTRRLLALAASAFVVLAAEPLYLLVDTAVVGHLGRVRWPDWASAAALMSLLPIVGTFVEYGTTGRAARWFGAGRLDAAVNEGVQASWLALVIGLLVACRRRGRSPGR